MRTYSTATLITASVTFAACFHPDGAIIPLPDTATQTDADSSGGTLGLGEIASSATTNSEVTSGGTTGPTGDPGCGGMGCPGMTSSPGSSGICDGACATGTTGVDETTGSPGSTSCDVGCAPPVCGDGHVDPPEECDDGNEEPLDGCDGSCIRARRAFVTAGTFDGNLGGIEDADSQCQLSASDVGLTGAFKAWLSDGFESPWARFDIAYSGTYLRTDGKVVAAGGWSDLTDGSLVNPIAADEFGAEVMVSPYAWTSTDKDGGGLNPHCNGWTTSQAASYGVTGSVTSKDASWTNADLLPCNTKLRLYCIEDPTP